MTTRAVLTLLLHGLGRLGFTVLVGLAAFVAGQVLGARDVELALSVTRQTQAARCLASGGLPVVIVHDVADPARDRWTCRSGSARRLGAAAQGQP